MITCHPRATEQIVGKAFKKEACQQQMELSESYARAKARLLSDADICRENRDLFTEFFRFEEYKLKRIRHNAVLDKNSYKTLLAYVSRLRSVNRWFENKSWRSLTREDIQKVYDDVEEGRITSLRSGGLLRDRQTYYKFILRGKPFEMAGKKELVKEVMQFFAYREPDEVRFILEDEFRRILEYVKTRKHRLFFWLCFDIGENAGAIAQLCKRDCIRKVNLHLNETEYAVNLRREILKRSRRPRTELTNYKETAQYLDVHLSRLTNDDKLFDFDAEGLRKILRRAARKADVGCRPQNLPVTLKDLRSSMACDLLSKGWSRDEVNARLGHTPSSRTIDKYINYLAIDGNRPKKKLHEKQIDTLQGELAEMRNREKLLATRFESLQSQHRERLSELNCIIELQSKIVALQISRFQAEVNEQEFGRSLVKLYNALVLQVRNARERNAVSLRNNGLEPEPQRVQQ